MQSFIPDTDNEMFRFAAELVNYTNRNIFLTGKAGTGKTSFLKWIRENCKKQMVVVAPTGVAAINAGGVTIHSFFQLPLSPFIPDTVQGQNQTLNGLSDRQALIKSLRFNRDKIKLFRELELLIIDEISMVRCDILDAIDVVLRHTRHRYLERFGGVQLLFIGDLFQLPPVVKEQDWRVLSGYYNGHYFFNSRVLEQEPPLYIEFTKVYRQNEPVFLDLLNQVRNNNLDEDGASLLESRYQPGFKYVKEQGYIVLTTHNNRASEINAKELEAINQPVYSYKAVIDLDFPDRAYPAELILELKVGAQVMFIRNDSGERGRKYFNGKIGIVSQLEEDKVYVICRNEKSGRDEDEPEIVVVREKWENIRYKLDKATGQLNSETLGTFTQFPLRLAWAITIHKSQGLTFEKAIIDAGEAFAPGQVYVALSRCTNLKGMILKSRIRFQGMFADPAIANYSNQVVRDIAGELVHAKENYRQSLIAAIFDFTQQLAEIKNIYDELSGQNTPGIKETLDWIRVLESKLTYLKKTAEKFRIELGILFNLDGETREDQIHGRISTAAVYFSAEIRNIIKELQKSPFITDSWNQAKEYNEAIKDLYLGLARKEFHLEGLMISIKIEDYQIRKTGFVLPAFKINSFAGASDKVFDSPHPILLQKLRKFRDSVCLQKNLPIYLVAGSKTLDEMARFLPCEEKELIKISGFGNRKVEQYGKRFLEIIGEYVNERNLHSLIHEKPPKRERIRKPEDPYSKSDTKDITFQLYSKGQSLETIAKERNLAIQTIEGHLAPYVRSGLIPIEDLVKEEKLSLIVNVIKDMDRSSLKPIKEKLNSDISFGEIRLAIAWYDHQLINEEHMKVD